MLLWRLLLVIAILICEGANGARIALTPQKDWNVNNPAEVAKVLQVLKTIQDDVASGLFNSDKVSLADLIVIGGIAAIEKAAKEAGFEESLPFALGRGDATQEQTDVNSFSLLELILDGFRTYFAPLASYKSPTEMRIDKADQLNGTRNDSISRWFTCLER